MAKISLKKIPNKILKLAHQLKKSQVGVGIFLVGGAVRDLLINRPTKDYDLVVSKITNQRLESFLKKHGKTVLVGKKFGVYKFTPPSWPTKPIDIALPRLDHSWGSGRYRDFTIKTSSQLSIKEDLTRRDFTINALALDLLSGEIIDIVGGLKDLDKKIIRTVGLPTIRFQEDFSRLLRALRFSLQLNFTIENKTWRVLQKMCAKSLLAKDKNAFILPREIIAREFIKSLKANAAKSLILWDKASAIKTLLPEVYALHNTPQAKKFHSEGDVFKHTVLALTSWESRLWKKLFPKITPSISVILATILHDIGKPLTLQTPTSHKVKIIRTPEHDIKGALLVPKIIERLKLTSFVDTTGDKVEPELVEWLVAKHMLLVHGKVAEFRPGTLYRYFFAKPTWGQALQQIIFADSFATKPADGRVLIDRLLALRKRLKQLARLLTNKGELKLLLNGNQLMKELKLSPGPKVGHLLKILTEAQLSKKIKTENEAIAYLKKYL